MWLNDIADPQRIDVRAEAHCKGARRLLVADLRQAIGVHRVAVIILIKREAVIVLIALGKADAIDGLAGSDDDLAHPELHRGFDDIIGAHNIAREGGVVGPQQNARDGGEMHHGIKCAWQAPGVVALKPEMAGQGVEGLPAVGKVGVERVDAGQIERF